MPLRWPVQVTRIASLLGVSIAALPATPPTAGDLAHCAGIAAPDTRLACYDTLAGRAAPAAVTAPAPTSVAPPTAAAAINATPTAPALPPTPAPVSTIASDPQNFGFSEAQQHAQAQPHAAPQGPAAIQARIAKMIDNRGGRAYLVLDNGQTWVFVDADADDARLSPGDPVTIKRASLGSFLLLTQSKHSYHVRRTQ
jgi:CubicO group peptidase (beta-lactamase class C family)